MAPSSSWLAAADTASLAALLDEQDHLTDVVFAVDSIPAVFGVTRPGPSEVVNELSHR